MSATSRPFRIRCAGGSNKEVNASSVMSLKGVASGGLLNAGLRLSFEEAVEDEAGTRSALDSSANDGAEVGFALRAVGLRIEGNMKVTRPLGDVLKPVFVRSSVGRVERVGIDCELPDVVGEYDGAVG